MDKSPVGTSIVLGLAASMACSLPAVVSRGQDQVEKAETPTPPEAIDETPDTALPQASGTIKLIFIHHSSGENWLSDENGGLGLALMQQGLFRERHQL